MRFLSSNVAAGMLFRNAAAKYERRVLKNLSRYSVAAS